MLFLLPLATAHVPFAQGTFTITEFHPGLGVEGGQWFEVHNNTTLTQNLIEQVFEDTDGTSFQISEVVLVPPDGYAVLAAPESTVVHHVLLPEGFEIDPALGQLTHRDLLGVVDQVIWTADWGLDPAWSWALDSAMVRQEWGNDLAYNWCMASPTPGMANLPCPAQDVDADGDGYSRAQGDCDEQEIRRHPGVWDDVDAASVDDDCDGVRDEDGRDLDADGSSAIQGDCDDSNPAIGPTMPEIPLNALDDDCDGQIDEPDTQDSGVDSSEIQESAPPSGDDTAQETETGHPEEAQTDDVDSKRLGCGKGSAFLLFVLLLKRRS